MAQQQDITYQYDLFTEIGQDVIRPFVKSEVVSGALSTKALQVKEACEPGRALSPDLMGAILCHSNIKQAYKQVKQNKGVRFEQIVSELTPILRGWLNYFQFARCKSLLKNLDSWIRRKLRCYRLKQCKRAITLQRFLESQGVDSWQSWILALSGKGHWSISL